MFEKLGLVRSRKVDERPFPGLSVANLPAISPLISLFYFEDQRSPSDGEMDGNGFSDAVLNNG
jgi:hypothetical protein